MLRYRRYLIRLLKRSLLIESTRTKHGQDSYMLFDSHADSTVAEQTPSHVSSHWFATGNPFYDSHPLELTNETIWEGKSFDDFGLLSSWNVNLTSAELLACTTPFANRLMSCDSPSGVTVSAIPTTVDPSELGGLTECGDMDQHELFDQRYYQSPVLHEDTASQVQKFSDRSSAANERPKCVDSMSSLPVSYERSRIQYPVDSSQPSLPEVSYIKRFDPDINRTCRSTAEEIIAVVRNQDLSLLRSILTEKKWPNHRSIGAHLDDIFELVVRDSHDTDEAVLFFRDL
uniref:Uncharacterized protein n=1 Tax=Angiostrongylus cantonensis TaxID=6313 RepID=A0A0K0CU41_ANGCA